MITIPLEIGDIILTGRFKNIRVQIKEINTDEYGNPTINGRSILKIRIPKLYNIPKGINEMAQKVKIKKDGEKYNIYACTVDGDDKTPLNKFPYETEQHATASAIYKGFDIEVPNPAEPKPIKNEKIPLIYDKPKELKLDKGQEIKLENLIRKIISEIDFEDGSDIGQKLKQYAELSDAIERASAELKALQKQFAPLDDMFVQMIDSMDETKERVLRTESILVSVKKKGYEAKSPKYKEAFELFYSKVNAKMKKMGDDCLTANTTMKKVASSLSVQKTKSESLNEGVLSNLWSKVKSFVMKFIQGHKSQQASLDADLDKLEKLSNKI